MLEKEANLEQGGGAVLICEGAFRAHRRDSLLRQRQRHLPEELACRVERERECVCVSE